MDVSLPGVILLDRIPSISPEHEWTTKEQERLRAGVTRLAAQHNVEGAELYFDGSTVTLGVDRMPPSNVVKALQDTMRTEMERLFMDRHRLPSNAPGTFVVDTLAREKR
jgi:hypothetical protein